MSIVCSIIFRIIGIDNELKCTLWQEVVKRIVKWLLVYKATVKYL